MIKTRFSRFRTKDRTANTRRYYNGIERLEDRRLLTTVLDHLGTYSTGIFDGGAAEVLAHDPLSQRLFVTNVAEQTVDVIDLTGIGGTDRIPPQLLLRIDTSTYGSEPTGVAVGNGTVAVTVRNELGGGKGRVAFFDADGRLLNDVQVGYGPDMVVFTPDGATALVANQGRPTEDYLTDQEGSVSIIDVSNGVQSAIVVDVGFDAFDGKEDDLRARGVRVFGPVFRQDGEEVIREGTASASNDLEPENIAVSADSSTAWITLQENNAIAKLDIATGQFVDVKGLGFKDHSVAGNGLDTSDKDGAVRIEPRPVRGMFQPDGIALYTSGDDVFLVTANEGNSRDLEGFNEEITLGDANVVEDLTPYQSADQMGRFRVSSEPPDGELTNEDGETILDTLYTFGTRSFSIWSDDIELVYDSGDQFERVIANKLAPHFNANDANRFNESGNPANFDNRSDDKGPEPESVVVGNVGERTLAFVGLERVGGVMVYDVTNPQLPLFESYMNRRDFDLPNTVGTADSETMNPDVGDLSVEGMVFIPPDQSPIPGTPLLVTANEVSGTTSIFAVSEVLGDLDENGTTNASDIDLLFGQLRSQNPDPQFDLTGDAQVDLDDLHRLVQDILRTNYGDSDLDGQFDSNDITQVLQRGEYRDGVKGNSTWESGDWNGDGDFDQADLVFALQRGFFV